ncbi:ATP-dependent nuclease [Paludibacterium paludis]|nr:AAA family ATPase [Paludibacterium paludis]
MRIKSLLIRNFRSISEATIDFDSFNCLVGPNGAGKSTILCALNLFFRETENASTDLLSLTAEDFHKRDTSQPIEVQVTFTELSAEAQDDLQEYVRHDQLVISAVATYDPQSERAQVKQYGQRLGMAAFKPFFKALGDDAKVTELKGIFATLREQFADLPAATTKDAMIGVLREYEAARPGECELIPSEDMFYGVSRGSNRLQKYIQWIYIPAVKDASQEQLEGKNTALGRLLARTVRTQVNFKESVDALLQDARDKYDEMLGQQQDALAALSTALTDRLSQWAHPDASIRLEWHLDPQRAVKIEEPFAHVIAGESGFEGELARFGHGFQRSYLLALLQELAGNDQGDAPTLLLGCEEPELYQHPPQARHLAAILYALGQGNAQVIVTTHSPYFVIGEQFHHVRMIRMDHEARYSTVKCASQALLAERFAEVTGDPFREISASVARVHQALQPSLGEMFFTQRLVLVEGLEDIAYVHAWLTLTDRMEEFRRKGIHLVATQSKSMMIRPLIIAQALEIPTYVIFDADGDRIDRPEHRVQHERDNRALLRLIGADDGNLFPEGILWGARHTVWPKNLGDCILGELKDSLGQDGYSAVINTAAREYGFDGGLKKHALMVGTRLALAFEAGARSASLDRLCEAIIAM